MTASTPEPERLYVSPKEFVKLSGLSLSTVHRYLKSGRIAFIQPGGPRRRILISRDALRREPPSEKSTDEGTSGDTTVSSKANNRPSSGPRPRWRKKRP